MQEATSGMSVDMRAAGVLSRVILAWGAHYNFGLAVPVNIACGCQTLAERDARFRALKPIEEASGARVIDIRAVGINRADDDFGVPVPIYVAAVSQVVAELVSGLFPIQPQAGFVLLSAAIGIAIALISAIIPYRKTARLDPIEVIQSA